LVSLLDKEMTVKLRDRMILVEGIVILYTINVFLFL